MYMPTYFAMMLFLSCQSSLKDLYEKERTETLSVITDIPQKDWDPDIRFQLSYEILSSLTENLIEAKINQGTLPVQILGQTLDIDITSDVESLSLTSDNQQAIAFNIALKGDIHLKHSLISFSNPFSAKLKGSLEITLNDDVLQVKANRIEDVEIQTKYIPQIKINRSIKKWINDTLKTLPSQEIMALNLSSISARSLRFVGNRHSLDIEALSIFPDTTPLPTQKRRPRGDWEMHISNDTLSRLVRQQTFSLPSQNGLYMDVREVSVKNKKLASVLRIWKLDGWGQWWRDYDIEANIETKNSDITLTEPNAKQIAKSKGAGLADPIALLGEGVILQEITKQIQYTVPKENKATVSDSNIIFTINGIAGIKDRMLLFGSLESDKLEASKPKRRRRKK